MNRPGNDPASSPSQSVPLRGSAPSGTIRDPTRVELGPGGVNEPSLGAPLEPREEPTVIVAVNAAVRHDELLVREDSTRDDVLDALSGMVLCAGSSAEQSRIEPSMGRKRRVIGIENPAGWVFNRMAEVYDARPAYPTELVDAIVAMARGPRVVDLGAGTGHLALPLAARGLDVVAVEPAAAMLRVLDRSATERGLRVEALHGKAEALPFDAGRFDLAVISDALHFLDAELTGCEVRRVLAPGGALAVVTCEFANTPFMMALRELMEEAAPRRPREISQAMRHLATLSDAPLHRAARFVDEAPVEAEQLEGILRSISFIGPAMNRTRFEAFRERLHALPHAPVWAREFTLYQGRKSQRAWTAAPKRRG